jgi:hypothetical protein
MFYAIPADPHLEMTLNFKVLAKGFAEKQQHVLTYRLPVADSDNAADFKRAGVRNPP